MHVSTYLGLLRHAEGALADAFDQIGQGHGDEPDVVQLCELLAGKSRAHVEQLQAAVDRYGEDADNEPERLKAAEFGGARSGGVGLLRDLQDLYALGSFVDVTWTVIAQAAQGLRDPDLLQTASACQAETSQQLTWLNTRIKQAAPQALIVAP
ncbi:hypothetical protein [Kribbella pratensis]|uniref:Ferritin-like metal-binding protein YciE n=1 Tax=Kribbella pratensis TaxID=2512112 RepID=A0A4R8C0Y4_9ACTN|nr:hypothetical protein [Kribbella pratensis]TDW69369.1 hypothetical protein EV653_3393 [Kribbella pratensis]